MATINTFTAALCVVVQCLKEDKNRNLYFLFFNQDNVSLETMIGLYYRIITTEQFSNALNMVMVMGHCCGLKGPKDFRPPFNITVHENINPYVGYPIYHLDRLPNWPSGRWTKTLVIPPACCKRTKVYGNADDDVQALLKCAEGANPDLYYSRGCEKAYINIFKSKIEIFFLVFSALTFILLMLLAVTTFLRLKLRSQSDLLYPPHKPSVVSFKESSVVSTNVEEEDQTNTTKQEGTDEDGDDDETDDVRREEEDSDKAGTGSYGDNEKDEDRGSLSNDSRSDQQDLTLSSIKK